MVTDNIELMMDTGYGAPELKKTYQRFFSRGLVFAVILHLLVVGTFILVNYVNKLKADELKQNQRRVINVTDL